jgi:hypothetical protein
VREVQSRPHAPHRPCQWLRKRLGSFEAPGLDPSDHIEIGRWTDKFPLEQQSARPDEHQVRLEPLVCQELPEDLEATFYWELLHGMNIIVH